jgi:hypothetical protein
MNVICLLSFIVLSHLLPFFLPSVHPQMFTLSADVSNLLSPLPTRMLLPLNYTSPLCCCPTGTAARAYAGQFRGLLWVARAGRGSEGTKGIGG